MGMGMQGGRGAFNNSGFNGNNFSGNRGGSNGGGNIQGHFNPAFIQGPGGGGQGQVGPDGPRKRFRQDGGEY